VAFIPSPYVQLAKDGQVMGLDFKLWKIVEEKLDLQTTWLPFRMWNTMFDLVNLAKKLYNNYVSASFSWQRAALMFAFHKARSITKEF